jgi:hypothetical protein
MELSAQVQTVLIAERPTKVESLIARFARRSGGELRRPRAIAFSSR